MSDSVLSRSKLIAYFQIDGTLDKQLPELYRPQTLPLNLFHFHYPAIYFPLIFQHFKIYFPANATHNNVRIKYKGEEVPIDLPIGLFVQNFSEVQVTYSPLACPQAFKLMMISWKKGYTIVNKEGGCDHLFKKLNLQSQMELFNLHKNGCSHGLNKVQKYEGNLIALRLLINNRVVERKQANLKKTIKEYLQSQFGQFLTEHSAKILSHNIEIDLELTLKELLEEWNYNDGYCYLKIVSS